MEKTKKRNLVVFAVFLLLNLIVHIYISFAKSGVLLNWYLTDDAFYYFKTAQNITEGNGITFDSLSPTNGFHPLWMLICVPVFAFAKTDLYLPLRILVVVMGVLNTLSGYLFYRILADRFSAEIGLLAACFWMFLPSVHSVTTKLGLESGINAVSLFLLIFLVSRFLKEKNPANKPAYSIFLIALAGIFSIFSRLDNVFIVGMIGIWLVFYDNQIRHYAILDFFLILVASVVSYYFRIQSTDNILNFLPFAYSLIVSSLILKPIILFFMGGYDSLEKTSQKKLLFRTTLANLLSSSFIAIIIFLLFDVLNVFKGYSRSVLILDFSISTLLLVGVRLLRCRGLQAFRSEEIDISFKRNWQKWLTRAAAYFVPIVIALAAYMFFNVQYSGSAMPVSGKIKHWWGTIPHTIYGRPIKTIMDVIASLFDPFSETGPLWLFANPIHSISLWIIEIFRFSPSSSIVLINILSTILWIGLAAMLLILVYRFHGQFQKMYDQLAIPALALGFFIHILYYKATGYLQTKYWYWISAMILVFLFFFLMLGLVVEKWKLRTGQNRLFNIVFVLLSGIPLIIFGYSILSDFPANGKVPQLYDIEAETNFIERNTQTGDVIGMTGGGLLGYFIPDRTFVNLDGLINSPEYFELMKSNQTDEYLKKIEMKYIYGEEQSLLESDPYRWMFTGKLKNLDQGPFFSLFIYCDETCVQ